MPNLTRITDRRQRPPREYGLRRHRTLGGAVDEWTSEQFAKEARARGISKSHLLALLVETVVEDKLFDAVLG